MAATATGIGAKKPPVVTTTTKGLSVRESMVKILPNARVTSKQKRHAVPVNQMMMFLRRTSAAVSPRTVEHKRLVSFTGAPL